MLNIQFHSRGLLLSYNDKYYMTFLISRVVSERALRKIDRGSNLCLEYIMKECRIIQSLVNVNLYLRSLTKSLLYLQADITCPSTQPQNNIQSEYVSRRFQPYHPLRLEPNLIKIRSFTPCIISLCEDLTNPAETL